MKVIIPMAGMGKRLRPHTLTTPKPLVKIAGKPIVQRLVEELAKTTTQKITEIGFVIGDFSDEIKAQLHEIAENLGAEARIYRQEEALGTAHAIFCAEELLKGEVIIAFSDTLFKADFDVDPEADGMIWVKKVKDPSAFGVVKIGEDKFIKEFVEKPAEFVSDLAIIGIYYIKSAEFLKSEIATILENDIREKGEYQLTTALANMAGKGANFVAGKVNEWMDCGNSKAVIDTVSKTLEYMNEDEKTKENILIQDSLIIQPCFIDEGAMIFNSVVGPHVSIGKHTIVRNSNLTKTVLQDEVLVENANLNESMLGNKASFVNSTQKIDLGDYSNIG